MKWCILLLLHSTGKEIETKEFNLREWVNLTQMIIISTTVGKIPLEWESWSLGSPDHFKEEVSILSQFFA